MKYADGANRGRLVIFDCDGVLVDSESLVSEAEAKLLAGVGVHLTAEQISRMFVGLSEEAMAERIEKEWGVALGSSFTKAKTERISHLLATSLLPVSGIAQVLEGLMASMCVASSSSPERVRLSLHKTGLSAFFGDHVFTASMVRRGKPAPDLFLLAAGTMGFPPAGCVVVEDSVFGVEAARAARMDVVGFTGGSHCSPATAGRLYEAGARKVVASAGELGEVLASTLTEGGDG